MSSFGRERVGRMGWQQATERGLSRLCGEILLCLELELSFDADELIQPSVEGTMAATLRKSSFSIPVVTWLRASPLSDWQLNSCIR